MRARIFSNSSAVTRPMPFLRHESSTAFTTIPLTNTGTFFMRAAAASSHAMVVGDSGPYSIAEAPSVPETDAPLWTTRRGEPANVPGVWVQRIFGHRIAGHPVGAGTAASTVTVHLALPAPPAERGALANVGEQPRRRPEIRQTRAAKRPREDGEIGARRDIAVRPYPHVMRSRRAPAGASGVGPEGHARRFGSRRNRIGLCPGLA